MNLLNIIEILILSHPPLTGTDVPDPSSSVPRGGKLNVRPMNLLSDNHRILVNIQIGIDEPRPELLQGSVRTVVNCDRHFVFVSLLCLFLYCVCKFVSLLCLFLYCVCFFTVFVFL
jgi:hypothetical protein